jgi:hypothetical protein
VTRVRLLRRRGGEALWGRRHHGAGAELQGLRRGGGGRWGSRRRRRGRRRAGKDGRGVGGTGSNPSTLGFKSLEPRGHGGFLLEPSRVAFVGRFDEPLGWTEPCPCIGPVLYDDILHRGSPTVHVRLHPLNPRTKSNVSYIVSTSSKTKRNVR